MLDGDLEPPSEESEIFLHLCIYCKKQRNAAGYWDTAGCASDPPLGARISHGICPECYRVHFPSEYDSLKQQAKIVIRELVTPDNRVLYGCFPYN